MVLNRLRNARWAFWPTLSYFGGMALLLAAERIIAAPGPMRSTLRVAAAAAVLVALAARIQMALAGGRPGRRVELLFCTAYAVGCIAVALPLASDSPLAASAWPILWLGSAVPLVLVELSLASAAPGQPATDGRIGAAAQSGLEMVLTLTAVVALNFLASSTEKHVDLSYLQATRPSLALTQIAARLPEPVQVRVFYPEIHEVRQRLVAYFGELKRLGAKLDVAFLDEAIDHAAAVRYRVQGNGTVVVAKDNRMVPITLGLEWEVAKRQLEDFDSQLQWAINKVSRSRKVYFISGHGEADTGKDVNRESGPRVENPLKGIHLNTPDEMVDPSRRFTELHKLLRSQGYEVDQLGTTGLVSAVPKDAVAVFLVAPSSPLFAEEIAELRRYFDGAGRLLVFLDPDRSTNLEELLGAYRVRFVPQVLANEYLHMRKTSTPSDNTLLVTNSYSTHPSALTISRSPSTFRMLLARSGYLEEIPTATGGSPWVVYFTIHADPQTFADLNGNYQFDPPSELRRPYELAAAVVGRGNSEVRRESRMLVYADVDVISDALMTNPGNRQAIMDALSYLTMDEAIPFTTSISDPMIRHTQQQDKVWFYSVSFAIPVLVLVGGMASLRRPTRRS
ncbi:MAG TPA: Gldg family protein [Myxococcaceae bacterium]|nr:Gldg family protein [Myxococcaceae bacterium]